MSLAVVATCFGLVAVAELPDKTMIATLVLGSRGRPVPVWLGASAAFLAHVVLAVVAGRLIELLPHRIVDGVVAALFLGGAVYLLLVPERGQVDQGEGEAEAGASLARTTAWSVAATAFMVILVGEFGDLTQLLTINLVARYHQPFAVGLGAWLALVTVCGVGAFSGQALLRVLPVGIIRRIGGLVLLGFGGFAIYTLARAG